MTKPTVYIVTGVSGSGKSWVCERLKRHAKYLPYDKVSKERALATMRVATVPILYDPTANVSTFVRRNADTLDIKLIVITGDFLTVKQQLVNRGGKITKSLYRRWKRMKQLSTAAIYAGSSDDVLRFLREELKRNYSIYKATSPSGKVYIGKTSGSLEARISAHTHDASVRNKAWAFSRALRKYGKNTVYVHLADGKARTEPGSLPFDYRPGFRALKDWGFSGWLNMECKATDNPEAALTRALAYIKKQWAEA